MLSLSPPNKSKQQWHQGGLAVWLSKRNWRWAPTAHAAAECWRGWCGWYAAFSTTWRHESLLRMAGIWPVNLSLFPSAVLQVSHSIFALRHIASSVCSCFCLLRMKFWMLTYCPQQVTSSRCWARRRGQAVKPACLGPVIPASLQYMTLYI